MQKLNRMLFREIKLSLGQFIAAAAVIFAGIFMFAAVYMSYLNLKNSVNHYYREYRFLDYTADVRRLTPGAVRQISGLDGVTAAIGRISEDVGADMGEGKRVTLRLISLPDDRHPAVNDLFLIRGGYFNQKAANGCLVNQKFAEANHLGRGDRLKAIINRRIYEFVIEGVVASPEYLYAVKSSDTVFSSAAEFGILYIKESTANRLFDYGYLYNQLHVIFKPGVLQKPVIDRIEDILKPHGYIRGTERKDQLSNALIQDEISQLENMAVIFPALFFTVAAMIIYIMLRRIISNQRTLIGVMKALGYSNARIVSHYLGFSLLILLAGGIPGILAGLAGGVSLTRLYTEIYNIPVLQTKIYWNIILTGFGVSSVFCFMAGYNSAKRVTAFQPAEAMRPESPKAGRRIFLENFRAIWGRLSFGWKMSIRNIFRSRQRTLITVLGLMFTIMFFMVSLFFMDCMDYLLKSHFFDFLRQDYKVVFSKPSSYYDALELKSIRGIERVEPFLELPVELRNGWIKKNSMMIGLTPENTFYRIRDENRKRLDIPAEGVLISDFMAKELALQPGGKLTFKSYLGDDREREIPVAGVTKQYIGFNNYMRLDNLGKNLGEGRFATGALIRVAPGTDEDVKRELYRMPGIEMVESRLEAYRVFMQYMQFMYAFIGLMIIFGAIMGFAIVFNTTVINIMERRRELASLKVLGYTSREIENTIWRENLFLGFFSLIPGMALGRIVCELMAKAFSTELFAIEVILYPRTYVIAGLSLFLFIILAQTANRKNITGLDMVEVLKIREG